MRAENRLTYDKYESPRESPKTQVRESIRWKKEMR